MPKLQGRQTVLGFLKKIMFPAVQNIQVKQHIVEGEYVATVFDMETTVGVEHVCDLIHVRDGQNQRNKSILLSPATIGSVTPNRPEQDARGG